MNITNTNVLQFDDGNVYMWLEHDSSIMLKACTKGYNDPVELTSFQAKEIAKSLMELADKLEAT
jgi:hypothetical protein